jgi:hypothetical protein
MPDRTSLKERTMSLQFFDTPFDDYEFELDWLDHPRLGRLPLESRLRMNMRDYEFEDPPAVRIVSQGPTFVSSCRFTGFNGDLDEGATVLLGRQSSNIYPVHLRFDVPVRELGAYVSADAALGNDYMRHVAVLLEGQAQWERPFHRVAALSDVRGSAPFLALNANGGPRIAEVAFDVTNVPGGAGSVTQVAIGSLFYTP